MSNDYTDWSDNTYVFPAAAPSGWTAGWDNTSQWTYVYLSSLDPAVRAYTSSSGWARLTWDAPGSLTDCEIVIKGKYTAEGAGGDQIYFGASVRDGGTSSTKNSYNVTLWRGSGTKKFRLYKFVSNTATSLGDITKAHSANTDYLIRLQVIGTAIKAKFWAAADSEPAGWDIEVTDSALSSGGISLINYGTILTAGEAIYYFAGYTDSPATESAPIVPPTASVTLTLKDPDNGDAVWASKTGLAVDVSVDRDSAPFYSATSQSTNVSGELSISATNCPLSTGTQTVWIRITDSSGTAGVASNATFAPVLVTVA